MYIRATMTGTVWKILVAVGEQVEIGQEVIILESMKMEIPIQAEKGGRVKKIWVEEGSFVREDGVLIELEN